VSDFQAVAVPDRRQVDLLNEAVPSMRSNRIRERCLFGGFRICYLCQQAAEYSETWRSHGTHRHGKRVSRRQDIKALLAENPCWRRIH